MGKLINLHEYKKKKKFEEENDKLRIYGVLGFCVFIFVIFIAALAIILIGVNI